MLVKFKGITLEKGTFTRKDYNGNFELCDLKGNEIYSEDSSGFWIKYEYNDQGNLTYFEDSNGYWHKREYNAQGNEIYREDSRGYWEKREYDAQNELTYCKNSDGRIWRIEG